MGGIGIGEWWDVCARLDAAVKLVVFALSGTPGSGGAVDLFPRTLLLRQTVSNSGVGGKERRGADVGLVLVVKRGGIVGWPAPVQSNSLSLSVWIGRSSLH
jgi:hypothetical protein